MAKPFNVGFSEFQEAYEYQTVREEQEEVPIGDLHTIYIEKYDKHKVYECLECGTLTTNPPKHELRYHR